MLHIGKKRILISEYYGLCSDIEILLGICIDVGSRD